MAAGSYGSAGCARGTRWGARTRSECSWSVSDALYIEETDVAFAIDWKGHYRIKGAAFVFVDRNTRQTRTILGYPTHQLEHVGQG